MTAALAGIDAGSENPHERLRFLVFQRQQVMEVLKTKALILSALNNAEGAQKAANEYLAVAIPISTEDQELSAYRKERLVNEIQKMAPIPLSSIRFGQAITGDALKVVDKRTGKELPPEPAPRAAPRPAVKGAPPVSGAPKIPRPAGKPKPG